MDIFIHLRCRHFSRRQAAALLALLSILRKPAKAGTQTSLRDRPSAGRRGCLLPQPPERLPNLIRKRSNALSARLHNPEREGS